MDYGVIIYGAGGQGKVIANILESNNIRILGYLDDNKEKTSTKFYNYSVKMLDQINDFGTETYKVFIAIGNNKLRKEKFFYFQNLDIEVINAIHPKAIIAKDAIINEGTCVMAGVVVNPSVKIGKGAIINTSATIDHDCEIEDFAQISPGVNLAGTVKIKESAFVGTGAIINPGVTIGKNAIVGSGSVVIKDLPDNVTAVGNPARIIKIHK